jgi:5-methylcytosine-specific restriction endonuclease McrA
MFGFDLDDDGGKDRKRTLGIRDKQILYERASRKCEACKKAVDFTEMQVGHKKAHSKGGRTTMANCVCLCYRCNKLQGTDSWATFLRKMGKKPAAPTARPKPTAKKSARRKPARDPLADFFSGFRL